MPETAEIEATAKPLSNMRKMILDAANRLNQIDKERADLNEDASAIREELRNSGVQIEPFMFARRLWNQGQEARDEYLDNLRINFSAFGIGGQLDMFDEDATGTALSVLAENPPEEKAPAKKKRAAKK